TASVTAAGLLSVSNATMFAPLLPASPAVKLFAGQCNARSVPKFGQDRFQGILGCHLTVQHLLFDLNRPLLLGLGFLGQGDAGQMPRVLAGGSRAHRIMEGFRS